MARSSSNTDTSQTKSKARSSASAADDAPASTMIFDATPLRPRMMQRLIGAALIISVAAFALAVYPIIRPLIGSAFGLAALVPAWQTEMSTLRQQATEYRTSAEADRSALTAVITGLEQKIETALSAQQSDRKTLLEIQADIAAHRARLEMLEARPIMPELAPAVAPEISDTAPKLSPQAGNPPQQPEQQNPSFWPDWSTDWKGGWIDSWSFSGMFNHVTEMLSLRRVDEAPSS